MKMKDTEIKESQDIKTEAVCDIPRSENEVYRIARKEYKDRHFVDLRIFFKSKDDGDRLIPSHKGIWIEEAYRQELIAGLVKARNASPVTKPEGEGFNSVVVCDIPVSENEIFRISKGSGSKNSFVDIRRFFEKGGKYVPYKRKGVSIMESSLDDVITGLMGMEPGRSS